ncbi:MAG TPA: cupin domain-containing protein [Myxococcaceae bacterium]|jgi:quercetin dioxygenase-like cupin family protein
MTERRDGTEGYALSAGNALEVVDMGGDELRVLVGAQQSRGTVSVIAGVMHGGGPPLHVHDDEDEVVIVVYGDLAYQLGERRATLGAGGLLWMPRGVPHTIASGSSEPCRFVTLATPGGLEELFRVQSEYFASLAPGAAPDPIVMAALPGAARRRVIGPPLEVSNTA